MRAQLEVAEHVLDEAAVAAKQLHALGIVLQHRTVHLDSLGLAAIDLGDALEDGFQGEILVREALPELARRAQRPAVRVHELPVRRLELGVVDHVHVARLPALRGQPLHVLDVHGAGVDVVALREVGAHAARVLEPLLPRGEVLLHVHVEVDEVEHQVRLVGELLQPARKEGLGGVHERLHGLAVPPARADTHAPGGDLHIHGTFELVLGVCEGHVRGELCGHAAG
mmetsp:Transcript_17571/g.56654  ORF Transcript_17571/g.56654 Transcript_17571/m.56654 type:complete len:226 (+) Transcript_17571:5485-6162(+)